MRRPVRAGRERRREDISVFQRSGLPTKFIENVKLQIHGDVSRFQEARAGASFEQPWRSPPPESWGVSGALLNTSPSTRSVRS